MRRILGSLAVVAMGVLVASPCWAQFGGSGIQGGAGFQGGEGGQLGSGHRSPPLGRVAVMTVGGNQVTGMLADEAWKIKTEELGTIEVPSKSIRSVSFGGEKGDEIQTRQNSILRGKIEMKAIVVDSEFGNLTIECSKVRMVSAVPMGGMGMGMMGGMMVTSPERAAPARVSREIADLIERVLEPLLEREAPARARREGARRPEARPGRKPRKPDTSERGRKESETKPETKPDR